MDTLQYHHMLLLCKIHELSRAPGSHVMKILAMWLIKRRHRCGRKEIRKIRYRHKTGCSCCHYRGMCCGRRRMHLDLYSLLGIKGLHLPYLQTDLQWLLKFPIGQKQQFYTFDLRLKGKKIPYLLYNQNKASVQSRLLGDCGLVNYWTKDRTIQCFWWGVSLFLNSHHIGYRHFVF